MSTAALILVSGAFLALIAVVAAWLFRTASAPFLAKIVIPTSLMVLACAAPFKLPAILGWPVETTFADLPQQAELVAFFPYDDEKRVDLWLSREGELEPRSYSIKMTDDLKETLRKAQKAQAAGGRTVLAKKPKAEGEKHPGYIDIDGGDSPYVLLPNAFDLPKKGADE